MEPESDEDSEEDPGAKTQVTLHQKLQTKLIYSFIYLYTWMEAGAHYFRGVGGLVCVTLRSWMRKWWCFGLYLTKSRWKILLFLSQLIKFKRNVHCHCHCSIDQSCNFYQNLKYIMELWHWPMTPAGLFLSPFSFFLNKIPARYLSLTVTALRLLFPLGLCLNTDR